MSHFTVMVVGADIEKQLAPFQENNMGDCPKEHLAFTDVEDEYREKWDANNETVKDWYPVERFRLTDEEFEDLLKSDKFEKKDYQFSNPFARIEDGCKVEYYTRPRQDEEKPRTQYFQFWQVNKERIEGKGMVYSFTAARCDPPKKQTLQNAYPTFEEYMKDYCGFEKRDENTGRYGYWENPSAKWDWYQVGGRWSGYFKLKEGAPGQIGEISMLTAMINPDDLELWKQQATDGTHADIALKKHIDIEGMRDDAGAAAGEQYTLFEMTTKGLEVPKTWAEFREQYDDIDEARKAWAELPWVKAVRKARLDPFMEDIVEHYCVNTGGREAFVQKARDAAFLSFAVLKDGEWYERGSMGWWGLVSDEQDDVSWGKRFSDLIDDLPDDTLLTVVDCHI